MTLPQSEPAPSVREKYDRVAESYSGRYADPDAVAARQLDLICRWGTRMDPGSTVLEAGCGDGFSTVGFAQAGLRVTAFDQSPKIAAVTKARLTAAGVRADVFASDLNDLQIRGSFDTVAAFMGAFFAYVDDPLATLKKLAAATRVKLLVDLNPRATPLADAMDLVRAAGFPDVDWRAFLVPLRFRVPRPARAVLRSLERAPVVTPLLLRYKFRVVVKGEKDCDYVRVSSEDG